MTTSTNSTTVSALSRGALVPACKAVLPALLVLCIAAVASAVDGADLEMAPIIEQAKSTDPARREAAARTLLSIRESIAGSLVEIVADSNHGSAWSASKAAALYLMGELGVEQCRQTLEDEKDWEWDVQSVFRTVDAGSMSRVYKINAAKFALGRIGLLPEGTMLTGSGAPCNLADYPVLRGFLADLRSTDPAALEKAENGILRWYEIVCAGLGNVLVPRFETLYSDDVRVTAAYLLGEFRSFSGSCLTRHIELKDEKGTLAGYPEAIRLQTTDSVYPCAVALLKCRGRQRIAASLKEIAGEHVSQQGRERLARLITLIDQSAAQSAYESYVTQLQTYPQTVKDTPNKIRRLRSVAGILR